MRFSTKFFPLLTSATALVLSAACVADYDTEFEDPRTNHPGHQVVNDPALPPLIGTPPGELEPPQLVAQEQFNASYLQASEDKLFWVDRVDGKSFLRSIQEEGSVEDETLLTDFPYGLHAEERGVYIAQHNNNIGFTDNDGNHHLRLHESGTAPLALAVSGDYVYWATAKGCVFRGSIEGGDAQQISCGDGTPIALGIDREQVYWATAEGVLYRSDIYGSQPNEKLLTNQDFGIEIVVDSNAVYWADSSTRSVQRYSLAEERVELLAERQYFPTSFTADRFYLYISTATDGAIRQIRKTTGEVKLLAQGLQEPAQLVATNRWLYWVNEADGEIFRLSK